MREGLRASAVLTHFLQVLTGKDPFPGVHSETVTFKVVNDGERPDKPVGASDIGFSDSLWSFTQRCWDRKVGSRPKVGEIVTRLGEAAANWDGLMPPEGLDPEEERSEAEYGEFGALVLPLVLTIEQRCRSFIPELGEFHRITNCL